MKILVLVLLPAVLIIAACGGNHEGENSEQAASPAPTEAMRQSASPSSTKAAQPTASPVPTPAVYDSEPYEDDSLASLFSGLNPFQLLSGLGDQAGMPSFSQVDDPSLKKALVSAEDLPRNFVSFGDFSFSMPTEYGETQMAANMFASGDLADDSFGVMVMSAVLVAPREAFDQFGNFKDLGKLDEAELEEMKAASEEFGVSFTDIRVLEASGLGEVGYGMHMVMDFEGLFAAFGAPGDDAALPKGIAIDMYAFLRGDRMHMVMVMWSTEQASGVDGLALAKKMDARAKS